MKSKKELQSLKDYSATTLADIDQLAESYNKGQIAARDEALKKYPAHTYTSEVINKALTEAKNKITSSYLEKVTSELSRAVENDKYMTEQIFKTKYPHTSGDTSTSVKSEILTGELQINNAMKFLSMNNQPEVIIKAVDEALSAGRYDYANALLDNALASRPTSEIDFVNLTEDRKSFFTRIGKRATEHYENSGISHLFAAKENYGKLIKELTAFMKALLNNSFAFYSQSIVKTMKAGDMAGKIDDINKSLSYYK